MASGSHIPATTATRNSKFIFGLGFDVTEADAEITGSRLPSNEQVLRCFLQRLKESASEIAQRKATKRDVAKAVLQQIKKFYAKAHIPIIRDDKIIDKIIKIWQQNQALREIPKIRRETPSVIHKLEELQREFRKTFAVWPKDAEASLKNEEDREFLHSMMTDRIATFGGKDKVLDKKVQRKLTLEEAQLERVKREMQAQNEPSTSSAMISSSSEDEGERISPEKKYAGEFQRPHKRVKLTGTNIHVPHDIFKSPKLTSLATRINLTPSQQSSFTKALIEECGGDTDKVSLSYATGDRCRRSLLSDIARTSKDSWKPGPILSLHWDSKLMPCLKNKYENEERLAVLVGDSSDMKLLGVPSYQPGTDMKTGDIIAHKTLELVSEWGCVDQIKNMVFDTTSANTGHISAACVAIQTSLQKPLLWSACRHHVGEVLLTQIFADLQVETSKSPDVMIFSRFRKNYASIPRDSITIFDETRYGSSELVTSLKEETVQNLSMVLSTVRDDYKEFLDLTLLYLGVEVKNFTFKKPGALHKARWMAKLIYSIKICLLQDGITDLSIATKSQMNQLKEFVAFVTLVYSSWWFSAANPVDAPFNDLSLLKKILKYEAVNSALSNSAIKALKRHMWYLVPELVPLSLFSDKVPPNVLQYMAIKMLAVKYDPIIQPLGRYGSGFGKPTFPQMAITSDTSLADFIDENSWFLFSVLELQSDFLQSSVETWASSSSYQAACQKAKLLNVVNDATERSLKLTTDFINTSKTEECLQNTLQAVETSRKDTPNLRKTSKKTAKKT